jgi:hypothetical protein
VQEHRSVIGPDKSDQEEADAGCEELRPQGKQVSSKVSSRLWRVKVNDQQGEGERKDTVGESLDSTFVHVYNLENEPREVELEPSSRLIFISCMRPEAASMLPTICFCFREAPHWLGPQQWARTSHADCKGLPETDWRLQRDASVLQTAYGKRSNSVDAQNSANVTPSSVGSSCQREL